KPDIEDNRMRVRLEVADTGIGIAPENQSRIFEEFVQEDASTTRQFGGTGLRLAIARQLVELMGGQLSLVSTAGVGSTFSVELSLELADASAQAPAQRADIVGLRILIADDNAAVRRFLTRTLDEWGAHTTEAGSLPEILRELRATAYNAIVIDDSMLE